MNDQNFNRVSFALNVVLTAACVILVLDRRRANPSPPASASDAHPLPAAADDLQAAPSFTTASPTPARRGWVDVLRDKGVPEKVLAGLVLAEFDDRWQGRQAEAQEAYNRGDMDADGLAALDLQHEIEQEKNMRAVLGEDAFRHWDQDRLFQQFNLSGLALTAGESNSLYALAVNLRQRQRDLTQAKQQNQIDQATLTAEQGKAQTDFEQQVRALLGDDRYQALHGTDPTVGELRRGLRGLDMDDSQFSTLRQAQQNWETARSQLEEQKVETGSTNLDQQLHDLDDSRDQIFENVLGTNGYALFQKSQDSRYVEMQKNAARWGINDSQIDGIYDAIQQYEKTISDCNSQANALAAQGSNVNWDTLQQRMQTYTQEMAVNLRSNLGDARYDAISRNQILPVAISATR